MGHHSPAGRITDVTFAAIYLRISDDDERNGLAVERQLEDCQAILATRGWALFKTYTDDGITASKRNVRRPDYDQMVADYAAGKFTAIIVYDLDRLTRQPWQLEDWIAAAEDRGLTLVTANGEADLSTDAGRMFARVKAAVARAEIERKGARQRRANEQRVARGYPPPGRRLYGYAKDGVTPVEHEAAVVRRVFAEVISGSSLHAISVTLNEEGIPFASGDYRKIDESRKHRWYPKAVRTMILNPRYSGSLMHHGQVYPSSVIVPIVDEDTAERARLIVTDPARRTSPGNAARNMLSGIARCGVCQRPLIRGTFGKRQYAGNRRAGAPSYICTDGHVTMAVHIMEPLVVPMVAEIIVEDAGALLHGTPDAESDLRTLRERLAKNERAALATAADRDEGLLSVEAARGRLFDLRAERVELEGALDTIRREHAASGTLLALADSVYTFGVDPIRESLRVAREVAERFDTLPVDHKREVLRSLTCITLLPKRAPDGRWRDHAERVYVASRRRIEAEAAG